MLDESEFARAFRLIIWYPKVRPVRNSCDALSVVAYGIVAGTSGIHVQCDNSQKLPVCLLPGFSSVERKYLR